MAVGSKIAVEITANSKDLQAAVAKAAASLKDLSKVVAQTSGESVTAGERVAKANQGMAASYGEVTKAAQVSATKTTAAFGSAHSSITKFGKDVTLALAGVATGTAYMAVKFQEATSSIAGNAGITQKAADKIGQSFLATAGHTTVSAKQMVEAFAPVAGQLKLTEGHALDSAQALKVMTAAIDVADGRGEDLKTTTAALSQVMQSFHLSVGQAAAAGDLLFNVSRSLNIGVGQVAQGIDKLHGRLGILMPTMADVGGLMTSLAEHGIQGSRGIQVVQTSLTTLTGGSKNTVDMLNQLGLSMNDLVGPDGKFVGMAGVIDLLRPKLVGLTQQAQELALKTLFGSSAWQVMGQIIGAGVPQFQRATDAAEKLGTAHQAAEKYAHSLGGEMHTLESTISDLGVKIGTALIPPLTSLVTWLTNAVSWLGKHKVAAEVLAGVIGGVLSVAIASFVTSRITKFVSGVKDMVGAVQALLVKLGILTPAIEGAGAASATAAPEVASLGAAGDEAAAGLGAADGAATGLVATLTTLGPLARAGYFGAAAIGAGALLGGDQGPTTPGTSGPPGYPDNPPAYGETLEKYIASTLGLPAGYKAGTPLNAAAYKGSGVDHKAVNAIFNWLSHTSLGSFKNGVFTAPAADTLAGAKALQGQANASATTRAGFATDLLAQLGVPNTDQNRAAIVAWEAAENTKAANNPLAITVAPHQLPGIAGDLGNNPNQNNGNPVKNISSALAGVMDTAAFIQKNDPGVLQGLSSGNITAAQLSQLVTASRWGTEPFGASGSGTGGLPTGAGTVTSGSAAKPPGTSYHYNWQTNTYQNMTAAQYKALQNAWYAQKTGTPMPTSPVKAATPYAPSVPATFTNAGGSVLGVVAAAQKAQQAVLAGDKSSGNSILGGLQNAVQSGSLSSLNTALNITHTKAMGQLVEKLDATHNKNLVSLGAKILAEYQTALNAQNYLLYVASVQNSASALDHASSGAATLYGAGVALGINTPAQAAAAQAKPISGVTGDALTALLSTTIPQLQAGPLSTSAAGVLAAAFGGSSSELGVDFGALAGGRLNATDTASTYDSIYGLIGSLATLQTSLTDNTQATADNTSTMVSLLQQQNTTLSQRLSLNTAQTGVLSNFIPNIPHYASGGPVLDDGLIYAHKGEHVLTANQTASITSSAPEVHVHNTFSGEISPLVKLIDSRIAHPTNVMAVSQQIGRRTGQLSGAPGGFRR